MPCRRDITCVEEKRVAGLRFLKMLVGNFRDGHRGLPLLVGPRHAWQRAAVHKRKLAALEKHAAIGAGETTVAVGAICDDFGDGELACERLALRLEIDARRQAVELTAAGIRAAQL